MADPMNHPLPTLTEDVARAVERINARTFTAPAHHAAHTVTERLWHAESEAHYLTGYWTLYDFLYSPERPSFPFPDTAQTECWTAHYRAA